MGERFIKGNDGIAEDHKVRSTGEPVNRIRSVRFSAIKMSPRSRSQMPTCRKAKDAKSAWIDVPLFRIVSDKAKGALHIQQGSWMTVAFPAMAIIQNECSNAKAIQPVCDFLAFMPHRKRTVTSPRTDNDPRTHLAFFWQVNSQIRSIFVVVTLSQRRFASPQRYNLLGLSCPRHSAKQQQSQDPIGGGSHSNHSFLSLKWTARFHQKSSFKSPQG